VLFIGDHMSITEDLRMFALTEHYQLDIARFRWRWKYFINKGLDKEDKILTKAEAQAIVECYMLENI